MGEIKFRAWDKDYKVMHWQLENSHKLPVSQPLHTYLENKDRFEIMQYTGLIDKNGKEIYEGDIIYQGEDKNCWFAPRAVEFVNGSWMGQASNKGGYIRIYVEQDKYDYQGSVSNNEWIIIGNIYENPELL